MSNFLGDPEKAKIQAENRRRAMAEDEDEILEKSEMFKVEKENISQVQWELFNYICSRVNFKQYKVEGIDRVTGLYGVEWDIWGAIKAFYSRIYPYFKRLTGDNQRMRKIIAAHQEVLTEAESYDFKEICEAPGDYEESSRTLLKTCNEAAAKRSKDTLIYTEGRKGWVK